ncbi:Conserved_hypothetical protein [Hexamita inflata]|uniref:DUF4200 domain-containing protein n=2 Tax=Hexamita inflata TaxID=28002 RepID=A0AA86THF5_9EUKA|nr:Conserved hypothetical protein [Hexamita inflata]
MTANDSQQLSPQVQHRQKLAETYMTQIQQNPFSLMDDDQVIKARVAAKQTHAMAFKASAYIPLHKRVDNSCRSALLSLSERSPPPILQKLQANPVLIQAPEVQSMHEFAQSMNQTMLEKYAPSYTNKFADLDKDAIELLTQTDRQAGKRQRADELIAQQKEIFMVQLSSLTKRQEIDSIDGILKQKQQTLDKLASQLDTDVSRFGEQINQSDKGMSEAVKELENAKYMRSKREQVVGQLKNDLVMLKSALEKLEGTQTHMNIYQNQIEDLMNLKQDDLNSKRAFQEIQKQAVLECVNKFFSADGLCLDCLLYLPDQYQCCKESINKVDCKHVNILDYELMHENPMLQEEYAFLTQENPIEQINALLSQSNQNIYAEILISIYLPHILSIEDSSPYDFVDALRQYEASNFQLVESIQEAENFLESMKKTQETMEVNAEATITSMHNGLASIQHLLKDKENSYEISQLLSLQTLLQKNALNYQFLQKQITQGYMLSTGSEYQEAISTSLLHKLSIMEQKLEQLAAICKNADPHIQRNFEKQCDRTRSKRIATLRMQEVQLMRQEKIEKALIKNEEPIQLVDARRVVQRSYFKPKRHIGDDRSLIELEQLNQIQNYYDQAFQ